MKRQKKGGKVRMERFIEEIDPMKREKKMECGVIKETFEADLKLVRWLLWVRSFLSLLGLALLFFYFPGKLYPAEIRRLLP